MFDDLKPPGEDPHWEVFGKLHAHLAKQFPNVYALICGITILLAEHLTGTRP